MTRLCVLMAAVCVTWLFALASEPDAAQQKTKESKKGGTGKGATLPDGQLNPLGRPPAFDQGKDARYALWFDDKGWHLRATSKERATFEGRVEIINGTVSAKFQGLEITKQLKNADFLLLFPNRKGFDFRLVTFGKVDSIDFKASAEATEVRFNFRINGDDNGKRIFIGAQNQHPERGTFTLPAQPEQK